MKKILAIMGSPRKSKNTNKALEYLLNGVDKDEFELKKIYLKDLDIKYCTGCNYCSIEPGCIQKDDMQSIYKDIDTSDVIILAAPVYFNSVNGLVKNMIDRCQVYWALKYSLGQDYKRGENRIGVFLSVGGAPYTHDQFLGTLPVVDLFFKAINAEYKGNYFISNTDNIPVSQRKDLEMELNSIGESIYSLKRFTIQK